MGKIFGFAALLLGALLTGFAAGAQDIKLVTGTVTERTDGRALSDVMVYCFNTVPEAQDAMDYIKKVREEQGYLFVEAPMVETDSEGYYEIHVAGSGALVFFMEMADPVLEKVNGRLKIDISLLVGEVLDESKVTAEGGAEPVFDIPEFDGESIKGGVKFPIEPRTGKPDARLVFQTYMVDVEAKDTVLFRAPRVLDGVEYHQTQLRRMGFDPDYDPLYNIAEHDDTLSLQTTSISWKDSVALPNPKKVYFYNCKMWAEDYNMVYFRIKDTTIFRSDRVRHPMKFLDYSVDAFYLDPDQYRKKAHREQRETSGEINLNFPLGKDTVDPEDSVSAASLDKLRDELLAIVTSDGTTLKQFHVTGVASPEGGYARNKDLAQRRMNNIMQEITRVIPRYNLDRCLKTQTARVAGWDEVADILYADSLKEEAARVREISERYSSSMDVQMQHISALPYYKDIIKPRLPKLRSVNYTSVVEVYRELTPEEILDRYLHDKDYRSGRKEFELYEFWHLYNMVKDEDQLIDLYKRGIERSRSSELWALPACALSAEYIKREIADTTILAPFIDLRYKLEYQPTFNGKKLPMKNQREIIANQAIMMMRSNKFARAGQLALKLPDDETYHNLKLFTKCLAGYWKRDKELRNEIIATSPRNAVVMYLAIDKVHQAQAYLDKLSPDDPVTLYLKAQVMCRLYKNYYDMDYLDVYSMEMFSDAEKAADYLAKCFRKDSSYIDIARGDYDIFEKLFEKAMHFYENGEELDYSLQYGY